jgi:predicted nucleic acid-binding Zn ribbon protein
VPGELARIMTAAIARLRDAGLAERLAAAKAQVSVDIESRCSAWTQDFPAEPNTPEAVPPEDELNAIQDEAKAANDEFRERYEQLAREHTEAMAPFQQRLDALWQRVEDAAADVAGEVELPERPDPEPPDLDDEMLLFDSTLDWPAQFVAYCRRAAPSNGAEVTDDRCCHWCDGPLAPRARSDARFCSARCRAAWTHERKRQRNGATP